MKNLFHKKYDIILIKLNVEEQSDKLLFYHNCDEGTKIKNLKNHQFLKISKIHFIKYLNNKDINCLNNSIYFYMNLINDFITKNKIWFLSICTFYQNDDFIKDIHGY